MSESTKLKIPGIVTNIYDAAQDELDGSDDRLYQALEFLEHGDEPDGPLLEVLDLVASWPPGLREVVPLIEALTPEGKALLPYVLRAMAEHPGDCAALEASMGPPVSTAARVAAWAGGLDEADARLVLDAIRGHGRALRHAQQDAMADACVQMGVDLQQALGFEEFDAADERLVAERMPRRQLKGTCPDEIRPGQVRQGLTEEPWVVREPAQLGNGDHWWCSREGLEQRAIIAGPALRKMPLAVDFTPSDLAGLAKLEVQPERVWKAGTVPPRVMSGMMLLEPLFGASMEVMSIGQRVANMTAGGGTCSAVALDLVGTWKLAEDFHVPEAA